MEELKNRASQLKEDILKSYQQLEIDKKRSQRDDLFQSSQQTGFWDEPASAQKTMRAIAELENKISQWQQMKKEACELEEMAGIGDDSLLAELRSQVDKLEQKYNKTKLDLALSGPYDQHAVLLSIHAGAGGTDAQDWTQMLLRMYVRWAEKNDFQVEVLDESAGDEAGLKSVNISVAGPDAYGRLKGEHGVHRLVRLSPFNANNLRQTSFAKVEVLPKIDEPEQVPLDEKELKIDVFRAGGHGGQSVNTTDSAVRVTHLPTGVVVSIQNERSQLQNKETALTILRSKLASLRLEQHRENIADIKGPNQSAEWGNQIRSYVMHPYTLVKDLRTKHETSDIQAVLDGALEPFINASLEQSIKQ